MPGIIAWETHSGEEVERAIATYICLLNPRASHIRPSVGDGGIDVLVTNADSTRDIYQIKKYAANLKSKQKKDVEKSFGAMLEYAKKVGYTVRQWHLVMPLDPTKENQRQWFEEFTNGHGIECFWDGRIRIDGWAALMPQVGDYYFAGGMEYVREVTKEALSAARLSDSTNWPEIKESICAQQRLLDERDPHYSYSFHSYSAFEVDEPPFVYRPGVVMSTAEGKDGVGWVVMDVIAKHSASTQLAPMKGTFTVKSGNEQEVNSLRDFLDYGIPLPKMSGCVSNGFTVAYSDENVDGRDGRLWTFHSPGVEYSGPSSIRFRSRSGGQLELLRRESSVGHKGEYWEGRDKSGLVSLCYYLDYSPASLRVGLSLTDNPNADASVEDALSSIKCLYDASQDDVIMLVGQGGSATEAAFGTFGMSNERIELLYSLLCEMAEFNRFSFRPIGLSMFTELTRNEVAGIREVIQFCNGRPCCYRYERWNCTILDDDVEESVASLVLCVSPFNVTLRGGEYQLGQCVELFVGTQKSVGQSGSTDFFPASGYGDYVIRLYPKRQPTLRAENHVVLCSVPTQTEWQSAVDEAMNSHSVSQWLEGTCEDLLGNLEEWCA